MKLQVAIIEPEIIQSVTVDESQRFEAAESKIQAAKENIRQSFVVIGTELKDILESKLFRIRGAKTFGQYTQDRWSIGEKRAYQLIAAAEAANRFSTTVEIPNERITRELSNLSSEEEMEVASGLADIAKDRKITAKDARKLAAKVSPKKAAAEKARQERADKKALKDADKLAKRLEKRERADEAKAEAARERAEKAEAKKGKVKIASKREAAEVAESIRTPAKGGLAAEASRIASSRAAAPPAFNPYSSAPQNPAPKLFDTPAQPEKAKVSDPIKAIDRWWNSADGKRWHTYPWPGKPIDLVNVIKGLLA